MDSVTYVSMAMLFFLLINHGNHFLFQLFAKFFVINFLMFNSNFCNLYR